MTVNKNECREAFEKWAQGVPLDIRRLPGEAYQDYCTDHAWQGWQARAALEAKPPSEEASVPNRFDLFSTAFDAVWMRSTLGMTRHAAETAADAAVAALLESFILTRKP